MPEKQWLAQRCEEMNRVAGSCDALVPSWTPARVRASAAMFAFLAGDTGTARALAGAAASEYRTAAGGRLPSVPPGPDELEGVAALPDVQHAALALASRPAPGEFLHGLVDVLAERNAGPLLDALSRRPPPDEDEKDAWALVAAGDGVGLARWLRRPHSQPGTFLRLGAPLIRTGRAEVARWIRWGYRPPGSFRPTEEVVRLASLAAAAEAIDPAHAAPLQERVRRFREAVLRRETALPLAVMERL
jgi:hypothetical protein